MGEGPTESYPCFLRDFSTFLLPSLTACLLHVVVPGGLVGSPRVVILSASLLVCLLHSLLHSKDGRRVTDKKQACFITLAATSTFVAMCILFGAHPLRQHFLELLYGSCSLLPAMRIVGGDLKSWKRVFMERRLSSANEKCIYIALCSTLAGAWVGAFPILLDWNRPWQVWPVPCTVGALIGNLAGYAIVKLVM